MKSDYQTGEYIIDFVNIYQITSITDKDGDLLIHYQPTQGTDKVFTASIPEKNLSKGGFRKLLSPKEIKQFFTDLKNPPLNYEYNIRQAKEDIYLNEPIKTIPHLQYLLKNGDTLPRGDQLLREEIINHLCLEIAFVTKESTLSIRKKIKQGSK